MLASVFFVGAVDALKNAPAQVPKAARVTEKVVPLAQTGRTGLPVPTDPVTIVRINAGVQIAAAAALATGRLPRLSSPVLARHAAAHDGRRPPVLAREGPGGARTASGSTSSRASRWWAAC